MTRARRLASGLLLVVTLMCLASLAAAQGVTTGGMNGIVTDTAGQPIVEARVTAVHVPSGTSYQGVSRSGGTYTLANMRVGGPYRVTIIAIGFRPHTEEDLFVALGESLREDYRLIRQVVQLEELQVVGARDEVLDAGRTGAATFIDPREVVLLPSIKRSTRDLTRLDPRSDGNFAFSGRNWLFNNVSLDGSYFNNPYGLDDPAPGGQANAEPVPFDAIEQVEVSVAPFDVREGGFTGANINSVTKSGTNDYYASLYSFGRTDALLGNTLRHVPIVAEPELSFTQAGFAVSGPLIRDRLFFFANGEFERTDDPGTNFVANTGAGGFGVSRVSADVMNAIRARMKEEYNYETGPYDGFIHRTDNNKFLIKLDWNISQNHNLMFRYNYLDALRDLPPHPFAISYNNTGRGPNQNSLPFENSGYAITNNLNSFALEVNSRWTGAANRFFASFNRFRDYRTPKSEPFPTLEIGQDGVTYTTVGHEPFSISNILDQDVFQFTDNLTVFRGRHSLTLGANFESFAFFNSFNIFRHGAPIFFDSVDDFFAQTDPNNPNRLDLRAMIETEAPLKGENIHVGQVSLYAQDEFLVTDRLNLTYGVRVDFPLYFTKPVDNPYSRSLIARDESGASEVVDQSRLPSARPLFSPRLGFNWNAVGDRQTQVRGGTGVFTGRVPFVWLGNAISNPGFNPNLYPAAAPIPTKRGAVLQQSFDLNAIDPDFNWPQVWTTNVAVDQQLPWDILGTLEVIYGKDINAVFMRNADLRAPVRTLPDGRPYYGGVNAYELNPDGAGIYVLDNTSEGHSLSVTTQVRKSFGPAANLLVSYSYTEAQNNLKTTEIASVLWQTQPVRGDPNNPELSPSEFGQRHRIVGAFTYTKPWSRSMRTHVAIFFEVAEGNRFAGAGGNRYSFIYSGDVNGDGQGGNDLIYIPRDQSEIVFDPNGSITPEQQWTAFNAFIEQDKYLSSHRGQIAERSGALNPWYNNVDLRVMHDFSIGANDRHTFQLSMDILNVGNLLSSSWGIRKVANVAATSPLTLVRFDASGAPVFHFTGPAETYVDDPGLLSRWRGQVGLRYFFF